MENKQKESRWVHCPICGNKTRTKAHEDTVMYFFRCTAQNAKQKSWSIFRN